MNTTDILKYGHRDVLKTLDKLPMSAWSTGGVCGAWSVKDIVGHLAAYELMLQEVLAPFVGQETAMTLLSQMGKLGPNGFNNAQAELRKDHTPEQLLEEYKTTYTHVSEQLVAAVPADIWPKVGTIPWYGANYALDDFIVYTFYGHKREHCAQINIFKDQYTKQA